MRTALAAVAVVLSGCAPAGPGDGAAGTEPEHIRDLTAALFAAQTRGDPDATAAFFADDAVLHVAGSPPASGAAEIRAFYDRVLRFMDSAEAEPEQTRVAGAGGMAYDLGQLTTIFGAGDAARRFEGRYLVIWRRDAEEWRIAALAITSGPE